MLRQDDRVRVTLKRDRSHLPSRVQHFYELANGRDGCIDHIIEPKGKDGVMYHVVGDDWSIWAWDDELTQVLGKPVENEDQLALFGDEYIN